MKQSQKTVLAFILVALGALLLVASASIPKFGNPSNAPVYDVEITGKIGYAPLSVFDPKWFIKNFAYTAVAARGGLDLNILGSIAFFQTQDVEVIVRLADPATGNALESTAGLGGLSQVSNADYPFTVSFKDVPKGSYTAIVQVKEGDVIRQTSTQTIKIGG